ncbi:MAG TPA: KTSC domain-containing protein [Chthoniobacterales bacterium]
MAVLLLAAITVRADPAPVLEPVGVVSRIKRLPIQSTALATVGYSKRLHALEIEFRNGAIYRYLDVPPNVYAALIDSRSKARFYDDNIRHKYRSLHVRPRAE